MANSIANFECGICHAHATGFHFNAQSCQACCAFFRRAITLNRQYPCLRRQKNGNREGNEGNASCLIHYTEKILCRACRLQKCFAVGMDRSQVQMPKKERSMEGRSYFTKSGLLRNKRFAKGAIEVLEENSTAILSPSSAPSSIISVHIASPKNESTFEGQKNSISPNGIGNPHSVPSTIPSTSSSSESPLQFNKSKPSKTNVCPKLHPPIPSNNLPKVPNWDLLSILVEEEMRIGERRRILFCERPVACLLGKNKFCPFTKEDIKPLRFQEFRRSIRTHILLVYEWLRVWPGFEQLRMEDRITLLRKCVLYHTVLDPCILTIQVGDLDKFVLPNGGYVSTKYPPEGDGGWADEPEISHETKMKIYWPLLVPLMSGCVAPMLRLGLKFEELVALKAVVSFQMTLPDISIAGRALISRELESLCRSLYTFYGTLAEFNDEFEKAERFGNLLLLLTPIIETANIFVESHHIVQFFDLWQMDSLMLQFLQNKAC